MKQLQQNEMLFVENEKVSETIEEGQVRGAEIKGEDDKLERKEDMVDEEMKVPFWRFLLKVFCKCGRQPGYQ